MNEETGLHKLFPDAKPFKGFSEDWYKGYDLGKMQGIEFGREQIKEELRRLLDVKREE